MSFRDQLLAYVRAEKLDYTIDPDGASLTIYQRANEDGFVTGEGVAMHFLFTAEGAFSGIRLPGPDFT